LWFLSRLLFNLSNKEFLNMRLFPFLICCVRFLIDNCKFSLHFFHRSGIADIWSALLLNPRCSDCLFSNKLSLMSCQYFQLILLLLRSQISHEEKESFVPKHPEKIQAIIYFSEASILACAINPSSQFQQVHSIIFLPLKGY